MLMRLRYTITVADTAAAIQMVANFLTKNSLAQNRKILLCGLFVCVTTIVLYCICCKFIAIISLDIIMPFSIGIALLSAWILNTEQQSNTKKHTSLNNNIIPHLYVIIVNEHLNGVHAQRIMCGGCLFEFQTRFRPH